jgi:hypothetical protein
LGIYQIDVDIARLLDGFQNGALGDFVENDTLGMLRLQFQHFV